MNIAPHMKVALVGTIASAAIGLAMAEPATTTSDKVLDGAILATGAGLGVAMLRGVGSPQSAMFASLPIGFAIGVGAGGFLRS